MAIENKRMQQRHGTYDKFIADKGKYIPGEFQVVQSGDPNSGTGKGLYIAMDASECEQLATFENVKKVVDDSAEEIKEEYLSAIQKATSDANTASGKANTAASDATKATQNAINATEDARDVIKQIQKESYMHTALQTFINEVSASPTKYGNAIVEKLEGYIKQGADPSPDNPQFIHGVGDTGFFDGELQQGVYKNADGSFTNISYGVSGINKIPVKPNDIVKLVSNPEYIVRISLFQNNGDFIKTYVNTNPNQGFIETESLPELSGYVLISVQSFDNVTPITPQTAGHITVTINGNYAVILDTVGKNLFDASKLATKSAGGATVTNNGDGSFTISGSGNLANSFDQNYIYSKEEAVKLLQTGICKLNPDFDIDINPGFVFGLYHHYSDSDIPNKRIYTNRKITSFTVTQEDIENLNSGNYELRAYFYASGGTTISGGIVRPMIYQNGDDTFIPYQSSRTYIPISSPLYSGDKIYQKEMQYRVSRQWGVAVFDGASDENWGYSSQRFSISISDKIGSVKNEVNIFCDKFNAIKNSVSLSSMKNYEMKEDGAVGTKYVFIRFDEKQSVSSFKTWLQSNPITVVYQLATPTDEPLSQDGIIAAYSLMACDEITSISIAGVPEDAEVSNQLYLPRNIDGAWNTTAFATAKRNEIALKEQSEQLSTVVTQAITLASAQEV